MRIWWPGVETPATVGGGRLFLCNSQRDPAILLTSFRSRVVRDRMLLTVTLGIELRSIDTALDQLMHNIGCASLRQPQVGLLVAGVVGVAANLHLHVGIRLEDGCNILQ